MMSITSLQCIFMLFILCIVRLGCCAPQNKDNVTNTTSKLPVDQPKGMQSYSAAENIVTNTTSNLPVVQLKGMKSYLAAENNVTNITSNPPVDQPKAMESYSAAEMCNVYSKLIYKYIPDPILTEDEEVLIKVKDCLDSITLIINGTKAEPKEFPHMVLLGYSRYPEINSWSCGGSLISNRWILSAAHCERLGNSTLVRWARVGDLNYLSDTDDALPMDYQIDQRVIHPNYQPPSLYNDIALFHLDLDVKFSAYVRPICLNADPNWQTSSSQIVVATGWGQTQNAGPISPDLLRVTLDIISPNLCESNYAKIAGSKQLSHGIVEDSMICAGYADGEKDTCGGDSGGPLQIAHSKYSCMYTQVGVTSAGKKCATKDYPGIYTRVSKYLPWIERIVWPKSA